MYIVLKVKYRAKTNTMALYKSIFNFTIHELNDQRIWPPKYIQSLNHPNKKDSQKT